jgi:hypothetical protein
MAAAHGVDGVASATLSATVCTQRVNGKGRAVGIGGTTSAVERGSPEEGR